MTSIKLRTLVCTPIIALTASFYTTLAGAKNLGADPYSVNWSVEQTDYQCRLEQPIPELGKVLFGQNPEMDISFEVQSLTPLYRGNETKLKATAPSWRADLSGFLITLNSRIGENEKIARFNTDDSLRAFKAMKDGYRLQLSLLHGKPAEKIMVSIEGLGFSRLLEDFEACRQTANQQMAANNERLERERIAAEELALTMAKLEAKTPKAAALTEQLPEDEDHGMIAFKETPIVERSLLHSLENLPDFFRIPFDSGDTEINDTAAHHLDQLIRRWSLAGMPPEVVLHGHADDADSTGSYINSDLRAQSTVRYLLERMPELKLRIEAHGDTLSLEEVSSQRVDVLPSDFPSWE